MDVVILLFFATNKEQWNFGRGSFCINMGKDVSGIYYNIISGLCYVKFFSYMANFSYVHQLPPMYHIL